MALRGGLPTESGAVGVEGPRLVEEALRSASPVRAVLFSESGERHHARLAPYLDRLGGEVLARTVEWGPPPPGATEGKAELERGPLPFGISRAEGVG